MASGSRGQRGPHTVLWALLVGVSMVGCGASSASTPPSSTPRPEPAPIRVERIVIREGSPSESAISRESPNAEQAARQAKRAQRLYDAGRYEQAAELYDQAWHHLGGEQQIAALFAAASAWDLTGQSKRALERYQLVAERSASHPVRDRACVRASRLLVRFERWQDAGELAERVEAPERTLGPFEVVALYSALALAELDRGRDLDAERFIERGRDVVERHGMTRVETVSRDVAQLYFALGELRRLRAERIHFSPLPDDFAAALERRAQWLLDAQSAYSEVMRARDAHWSAMAGFRIGQLYQKLHEDVMQVPLPRSADTPERRQLFQGAIRLRYAVLLRKARGALQRTLDLSRRTGERRWEERAEAALESVDEALVELEAALAALPYSREELRQALESLSGQPAPK